MSYKIPCAVKVAHSGIPTTLPTLVQYKQLTPGYRPPYPPWYSTTTLPTMVQYKQLTPGYRPSYPPWYSTSSSLLDTNHPTHPGTVQAAHSGIPPVQLLQTGLHDIQNGHLYGAHERGHPLPQLHHIRLGTAEQTVSHEIIRLSHTNSNHTTQKIYCRYQPGYN